MIDNGMHNGTKGTDFVHGSVVVYKCKDGFTLAGAASIHCKVDHQYRGVWSKPTPECKGDVPPVGQFPYVLCGKPPTIDNGMHNGTKGTDFVHGSTVAYKCNDGFTLAGAAFLQCLAGDQNQGVWSKPAPECRGDCLLCLSCCLLSVFKIPIFSFLCESSNQVILLNSKPSMLPETASVKISCQKSTIRVQHGLAG